MKSWLTFYQNIPMHIDPVAFSFGSFSLGWYAIMYGTAFLVVYGLLVYRIKKDLISEDIADYFKDKGKVFQKNKEKLNDLLMDLILWSIFGAILGGRLGYVLFYEPGHYWNNPWEIISPYDSFSGEFIGIYGMSYHGGLLGVIIAIGFFARKNRLNFWKWANFVIPAVPAGYFFGRVGNFLNLELYGRVTKSWMGMYFPLSTGAGNDLRFPSQIIEAFLEGLLLFVIFWSFRKHKLWKENFFPFYLIGYGIARIIGEFFREPDEQIGYLFSFLTMGQLFSLGMILAGIFLHGFQKKKTIV